MTHPSQSAAIETGERRPETTKPMFKARIGRFDDPVDRALMDELSTWVEDTQGLRMKDVVPMFGHKFI